MILVLDAIVYYSKYGTTKKYALYVAEALGVPLFTIKQAKKNLNKDSKIIYFAPVYGPKLKKYSKIYHSFLICAVCAVGIMPKTALTTEIIKNENLIYKPIYYYRGSLDFSKLSFWERCYFKRFKKNILRYKEVFYDLAIDYELALDEVFSSEKIDFLDLEDTYELINIYADKNDRLVS